MRALRWRGRGVDIICSADDVPTVDERQEHVISYTSMGCWSFGDRLLRDVCQCGACSALSTASISRIDNDGGAFTQCKHAIEECDAYPLSDWRTIKLHALDDLVNHWCNVEGIWAASFIRPRKWFHPFVQEPWLTGPLHITLCSDFSAAFPRIREAT